MCSCTTRLVTLSMALFLQLLPVQGYAEEDEVIRVIGVSPTHGASLPEKLIPFRVQTATSEDLERAQSLNVTDFLNENLGSVTVNEAQNNPLQSDVQYRGYTLSPLLGLPQGLAVYQNGVRLNEPFGDTINWDLLPESSIASISLIGGANPVFGLNALGGSLSITTKNGFTHPGHSVEVYGGSHDRVVTTLESGGNNGTWGYYFTGSYFDEDGWRDASPSDALNFFGALRYSDADTELGLSINHADTDLIGNGTSPVELVSLDRKAIFTSPDQTENDLLMLNLEGTRSLNDTLQLSGNLFYRKNETDSFNGDGSEFEGCGDDDPGTPEDETEFLCEEDGDEPIEDQFGAPVPAMNNNDTERNAINNASDREQEGFGGSIQMSSNGELAGYENQYVVGAAYQQGLIDFFSAVEIATLNADRSTSATGLFIPEEGINIDARNRIWSVYATDTFSVNEKLAVTASARYNNSHIVISDRGGDTGLTEANDELNGDHDFNRVNAALGLSYAIDAYSSFYGGYSESSRAPTPVELLCARPEAPCSLPNAFLADPPLEQVVTHSFEAGFRGTLHNGATYNIGGFHATNEDDIIFGSTGGATSNEGFFRNVGDTRRAGAELGLSGVFRDRLSWHLNYSFVDATFQTSFLGTSANHPNAEDLDGDGEDNEIQVEAGDRIPGIPQHSLKLGVDYAVNEHFSIGAGMIYNSDQVYRGDESNELDKLDDYTIFNLSGRYRINQMFTVFARVNNVFDSDYESFGLLGEANEIPGFDDFEEPFFVGPGAPASVYAGVRAQF